MAQDTIEVFKSLLPKKALINESQFPATHISMKTIYTYILKALAKTNFSYHFYVLTIPLQAQFVVLTLFFFTDHLARSLRNAQDTIEVLKVLLTIFSAIIYIIFIILTLTFYSMRFYSLANVRSRTFVSFLFRLWSQKEKYRYYFCPY